jgi:benzoylformate decarboxylase
VADPAHALARLAGLVPEADRPAPEPRPSPGEPEDSDPITGTAALQALADAWPADGVAVVEAPSSTFAARNRLRLSRPGSYYFTAGGGLGFALPGAVGVQLAQPDRPVVCVVGEGSAQYAIGALWTAAAYEVPVTFLVLRNDEYAILKWFAGLEQVTGAPGLDLPALDCVALGNAYGVRSRAVGGREELTAALREAIGSGAPELIEVPIAPGMWLD